MGKLFDKLKLAFLWGGIDKEKHELVKPEINDKNRRYLIRFSALSLISYAILFAIAINYELLGRNVKVYFVFLIVSLAILLLAVFVKKESYLVTNLLAFAFLLELAVTGMVTTFTSITEKATMFLISLVVVPLLFTFRPVYVILFEIVCEAIYIFLLFNLERQYYEIYQINLQNSVIILIISIIISFCVLCEKNRSIYNASNNKHLLETDALTGMLNRRSYEEELVEVNNGKKLTAVVSFDVNGLKRINDGIGHHAGDELIIGAGECISKVFSRLGKCFRVGGDEYIALLDKSFDEVEIRKEFENVTSNWKGTYNTEIHISYGLVEYKDFDNSTIQEIIRKADSLMYGDKERFYLSNHIDRRRK